MTTLRYTPVTWECARRVTSALRKCAIAWPVSALGRDASRLHPARQ